MSNFPKIIKRINRLTLPSTLIIISLILGSFYFASQVIKINSQENLKKAELLEIKTKAEREIQVLLGKENQEQENRRQAKYDLDKCISDASDNYDDYWMGECKRLDKLSERCIALKDMTFDDYAKQNNIPSATENLDKRLEAIKTFYNEKSECSCALPITLAERASEALKNSKDLCLKRFPQK